MLWALPTSSAALNKQAIGQFGTLEAKLSAQGKWFSCILFAFSGRFAENAGHVTSNSQTVSFVGFLASADSQ
jgi:hypothetical protein